MEELIGTRCSIYITSTFVKVLNEQKAMNEVAFSKIYRHHEFVIICRCTKLSIGRLVAGGMRRKRIKVIYVNFLQISHRAAAEVGDQIGCNITDCFWLRCTDGHIAENLKQVRCLVQPELVYIERYFIRTTNTKTISTNDHIRA